MFTSPPPRAVGLTLLKDVSAERPSGAGFRPGSSCPGKARQGLAGDADTLAPSLADGGEDMYMTSDGKTYA